MDNMIKVNNTIKDTLSLDCDTVGVKFIKEDDFGRDLNPLIF